MSDREIWNQSVVESIQYYRALPPVIRERLDQLISEIMLCKHELMNILVTQEASAVCSDCSGECCLRGKFHFTVLDLFAFLKTGTPLVVPDFSQAPACPYSRCDGCLMLAEFRPVTCIIFNCDRLEALLSSGDSALVHRYEHNLRSLILQANTLGGRRFDRPLLLCTQ